MKTFAISDIHGCYEELMLLFKQLPIKPERDRMVFLGDYIDRGKDTKSVIQQMIDWEKQYPHWVFLQGNHEDMLLDALSPDHLKYGDYYQWFNQGGKETKESYKQEGMTEYDMATANVKDLMPKEHLNFISRLPLWFEDDKYAFVHGGFKPNVDFWRTAPWDLLWIRDEFIDSDFDWGKKIIYGHTAHRDIDPKKNLEPYVQANKIGIDTAVCYSANNKMTAIELPSEKFYFQPNLISQSKVLTLT